MEASFSSYDFATSCVRLDEILTAADASYTEVDSIPARDQLTFTNGFYVNCSALFIDIRDSSRMLEQRKRPTLAKIYRAYISELVAVLKGGIGVREICIHGDAVWAVYDTPLKSDIDAVFSRAAMANSLVKTFNYKLSKKGIDQIRIGIGMSYGRALLIKAGYKGSGINDVVWMGDVVNEASHLCGHGNKAWGDRTLMVSAVFRNNLNDENKALLSYNSIRGCYHGDVVNTVMNEWLKHQP